MSFLWNIIRNFFVQHFFGGHYLTANGSWVEEENRLLLSATQRGAFSEVGVSTSSYNFSNGVSIGDWLSSTFTIIVLILLAIFLILFVKWIFKLFAGLLHH